MLADEIPEATLPTHAPADPEPTDAEPTAARWRTAVDEFALSWTGAATILRYQGRERAADLLPAVLAPLWESAGVPAGHGGRSGEPADVQESRSENPQENAERLVGLLEMFADAMADTGPEATGPKGARERDEALVVEPLPEEAMRDDVRAIVSAGIAGAREALPGDPHAALG